MATFGYGGGAEGYLDITDMRIYNDTTEMFYEYAPGGPFGDWVPYEPEAAEGNSMRVLVEVTNIGERDDFKVEMSGDFIGLQEFRLDVGLTKNVSFSFKMPSHGISIAINTYHWVQEVGWVWDTSSVWELLFPFMRINQ